MIDYFHLVIPYDGPEITNGRFLILSEDGEIEKEADRRKIVTGSYDSKITVWSEPSFMHYFMDVKSRLDIKNDHGQRIRQNVYHDVPGWAKKYTDSRCLVLMGNPSKFLQGQNLYGTDNFKFLAIRFIHSVAELLSVDCRTFIAAAETLEFILKRIDIAYMYQLRNLSECKQWIRAASIYATSKHQKLGRYFDETVIFGEGSKRKSFKFYCKGVDLKRHKPLFDDQDLNHALIGEAQNKLRGELTLRYRYLKEANMRFGFNWTEAAVNRMYNFELDRLNIPRNVEIEDYEEFGNMSNLQMGLYQLWKQGHDMKSLFPRRTFYRHRKYFLDNFQIDIASPPVTKIKTNVVPLIRVLEAVPVEAPDWIIESGLVVNQ